MSSVTQKIPNFAGGISQQPDELMPVGSVRDAVNVVPDVTDGLRKRTGSRLINPLLTDEDGTWFNFDFAPGLKFIGKISLDGRVDMFYCQDGLPAPVAYQKYDPTEDLTGSQLETGFPNCDQAAQEAAKAAFVAKDNEKRVVEAQFNQAIASGTVTEAQVYFDASPGYWEERTRVAGSQAGSLYDEWVPPVIKQGYAEYDDGKIFAEPKPPAGWTARKGAFRFKSKSNPTVAGAATDNEQVSVYEYIWERKVGGSNQAEIDSLQAQLTALQAEIDPLYSAYVAELNKCGFSRPGESQRRNAPGREIITVDTAPKYLQHEKGGQIRTLNVGDTIFFTNPGVACKMLEGSELPKRPTENFIELRTIAPAKIYAMELVTPGGVPEGYSTVTAVEVSDAKFDTDGDQGCTLGGQQRETFVQGDKKNLDLELTISGVGFINGDDDARCTYNAEIEIYNGGEGWVKGDIVEFTIKEKKYTVTVTETKTKFGSQGKPLNPTQTPSDGTVVEASQILSDMSDVINAEGYQTKIVGNGIYISHPDPEHVFSFATPEGQLMKITTDSVNNISELPVQCVDGYRCKVANTDSDFDDYYVEFETKYGDMDGPGTWVETVAPGHNRVINPATMPHKMIRNSEGIFVVSPIEWEKRSVGDEKTNPKPSFLSRPGKNDFRAINSMAFFRNRLCMLSNDNVICSAAGDYYNFWKQSALTLADNDPIDIAAGSTATSGRAALESSIEIAEGLLVLSNQEQHVLSTDSEVFGPRTAKFARVGTYRYRGPNVSRRKSPSDDTKYWSKTGTEPVSLGNSVAFLHESGLHTTMLEMYNIGRAQEATVNDLTKPIPRYIPFGVNSIASSKDNNIICLTVEESNDVWVYRYFDDDQKRKQSAWFRWTTLGRMKFQCIMDDVYWYVSVGRSSSEGIPEEDRDIVSLQRIDLKDELATAFVRDKFVESDTAGDVDLRLNNDRPYEAHLDNYRIAQPSEFTYYQHLDQTYFRAPLVYYKDEVEKGNLVAYMLSPTQMQEDSPLYGPEGKPYYFVSIGSLVPIRVEEDKYGTWFVMDGDWSKTRMMIGYQYEMKVEMPTLYITKSEPTAGDTVTRSDTSASLTLHRAKFNFGQNGVFECRLDRKGRDSYTELYEAKIADGYPSNEIAFDQERTQVVPIYAKNKDTKITLTSTHPSPATLISMEWEGDYTNMYYKRV